MATELEHIALANRNHDAICALLTASGEHPEWIATIAFYKALQIIEAAFAHQGRGHGSGHTRRLEILRDKRNGYLPLCKHYEALLEASEVARYLGCRAVHGGQRAVYSSFQSYMSLEEVKRDLLHRRLLAVESHAHAFLSVDARSTLTPVTSIDP